MKIRWKDLPLRSFLGGFIASLFFLTLGANLLGQAPAEPPKAAAPAAESKPAEPDKAEAAPAGPAHPSETPKASDSSGANYHGASTTAALTKSGDKITEETLARDLKLVKIGLNMMWSLICGFMVMFMQAGFALVESGLTRAKNVAHTMGMNFLVYAIGMLTFWACGFAIMMGGYGPLLAWDGPNVLNSMYSLEIAGKSFDLFGMKGFFLIGESNDASLLAFFLFQMVFMDTTATIPTGALAERWKILPFIVFSVVMTGFIYPIYGCWVWGGGWLSDLGANYGLGSGHLDFAGSSVVHMTGGVSALAGALIVGARIGKFNSQGKPVTIPAHNIAMVVLGTLILAFGWFGFNAGSTLAATDLRIASVATCTMLATAAGCMSCTTYMWLVFGKPDPTMSCNGLLAGAVAITAPCAFVDPVGSVIIGGLAGVLVIWSVLFFEKVVKIDDPVGAVSVHGVCGMFGCICLGLFANGEYGGGLNGVAAAPLGLFYGGGTGQLFAQIIGVVTNILWVFPVSLATFQLIEITIGNRPTAEAEISGLDIPEMGVQGYVVDATSFATFN